MKPKFWGVIAFLLTLAIAAAPVHSREVYVASATQNGDSTYMALNPDGSISDQQKLVHPFGDYLLRGYTFGNGIGDFNNDGQLDYILGLGRFEGDIYVFPKTDSGPQFDPPVWVGSWTEGVFPADIAVADFNGDGNMDFVMKYFYSTFCGLYLGDGAFGFTYTLLGRVGEEAAPFPAVGIDAADFNNDEIADFIVAPNGPGPFYVHLGNPDGTFTRILAERSGSTSRAFGIAAGNFIEDPDGFTDLAVSAPKLLEVYRGNGDGTFVLEYSQQFPMNPSPLDNGDFNRDGHQDLVAADYGLDHGGVAVLLGDGQGNFEWDHTYLGESTLYRKAVTALPWVPNQPPVAHVTPQVIKVTVGETIQWDASGSYDEDGTIVSYEWDYGDGVVAPMAMAATGDNSGESQSSYVYYDSGTYFVTLKVTDDQGASTTVQAKVEAVPLAATVRFSPRKLNLKSKGKWITATIRVPGYSTGMINPDTLFLELPNEMGSIKAHVSRRDFRYNKYLKKKYHRKRKLKVKFDRQELIERLKGETGPIALTVSGEVDSLEFAGTGTIHAFEKQKNRSFQKKHWKQIMGWFSKGKSKHDK
jgi:hypothetical protein